MFEAILQEQGMRTDITKHKKNSWFMYEVSILNSSLRPVWGLTAMDICTRLDKGK